jgi:hypothetical protein
MQTDVTVHDTDQEQGSFMNSTPNRGGSRKEKQMHAWTKRATLAVPVTVRRE